MFGLSRSPSAKFKPAYGHLDDYVKDIIKAPENLNSKVAVRLSERALQDIKAEIKHLRETYNWLLEERDTYNMLRELPEALQTFIKQKLKEMQPPINFEPNQMTVNQLQLKKSQIPMK